LRSPGVPGAREDAKTTTIRFWVMGYEGDMVAQMLAGLRTHASGHSRCACNSCR
jgi:hypothetical protein